MSFYTIFGVAFQMRNGQHRTTGGIVTLIGVAAKDRIDAFSGYRARSVPYVERVGSKPLERGSAE